MPGRTAAFVILLGVLISSNARADYPITISKKPYTLFDMRLSVGSAEDSTTGETGLGVDFLVSLRMGVDKLGGSNVVAMPEVGVTTFDTTKTTGTFFVGGIGLGMVEGPFVIGLVPSYIGGEYTDPTGVPKTAHGFRTTAFVELTQIIGVQATYQRFGYGDRHAEQVMFTGSLNLIPLLIMARAAGS
jgi:hypothetical protein